MKNYKYKKIQGIYILESKGVITLLKELFFCLSALRGMPKFTKKASIGIAKSLIKVRLFRRSVLQDDLVLPVQGSFCVDVHRGYRVFNCENNRVFRYFLPDVDAAVVAKEFAIISKVEAFSFVPKLFSLSREEGWYEEELVDGLLAYVQVEEGQSSRFDIYTNGIESCLFEMISHSTKAERSVEDIVEQQLIRITRLQQTQWGDESSFKRISKFIDHMAQLLEPVGKDMLVETFTHGDFSLRNILLTKHGVKVIDWEESDNRTVISDLYNYFFTEVYYKRARPVEIFPELRTALTTMSEALSVNDPDLASCIIEQAVTYRRAYFIERISSLLDRKMDCNLLDVVDRLVTAYQEYELYVTEQQ